MNKILMGFIRKELAQTLRDKRMRIVLFIMPMIQMTIFGLAISTEVRGIRLKILRSPSDRILRHLEQRSFASQWFIPARTQGNNPMEWIRSGSADAVILAEPGGGTKNFERGEGKLQLLVEATNAVRARSVENYVRNILEEVLASEFAGTKKTPPLSLDIRVLYNPSMRSAIFMVPGVVSMILAVLTIILTSMSMAREKEIGTFETLISAPITTTDILLGKTLPYVILGLIDFPLIVSVGIFLFGVPVRGQLWQLAIAGILFICTTVCIGTLISTFARNQQQAMLGGFLFLFPAILLSGIMFPVENMPNALKIFAYLDPLKYFVTLMRNILLKGGDNMVLLKNASGLTLLGISAAWLTYKRFRPNLN